MHNDPVNARYERSKKAVVVTFRNGAEMSLPIRLLEMIAWDEQADGWMPISPSDEQLEAVAVGGDHLYWDELGQDFLIPDLMAGIYGRPEWMRQLEASLTLA